MKTKLFLILFILFQAPTAKSQLLGVTFQIIDRYTVIDTARYVITYTFDAIIDTTKMEKKTDKLRLEVGNHLSKIYSLRAYHSDSLSTEYLRKGIDSRAGAKAQPLPDVIYKNYPSNKLTFVSRTVGGVFRYEEDYPITMKWKLLPEKKKILDYTCQKAETVFRGRTYTAWFTMEIPLKEGPGKFGGLPGLILQLYDSQNHFNYTCVSLEKPKMLIPITYWSWQYKDISRKKYLDIMRQMYKTPLQYLRANGDDILFVDINKNVTPMPDSPSPYNPMERE